MSRQHQTIKLLHWVWKREWIWSFITSKKLISAGWLHNAKFALARLAVELTCERDFEAACASSASPSDFVFCLFSCWRVREWERRFCQILRLPFEIWRDVKVDSCLTSRRALLSKTTRRCAAIVTLLIMAAPISAERLKIPFILFGAHWEHIWVVKHTCQHSSLGKGSAECVLSWWVIIITRSRAAWRRTSSSGETLVKWKNTWHRLILVARSAEGAPTGFRFYPAAVLMYSVCQNTKHYRDGIVFPRKETWRLR